MVVNTEQKNLFSQEAYQKNQFYQSELFFDLLEGAEQGTPSKNGKTDGTNAQQKVPSLPKSPLLGIYGVVFFLLLDAMIVKTNTIGVQSKALLLNGNIQSQLNQMEQKISFAIVKPDAKTATIEQVQDLNENYAAERENIQSMLITARQNNQVEMTQASTNVDVLEQNASEDSGWLKTLNVIFQLIAGMTKKQ